MHDEPPNACRSGEDVGTFRVGHVVASLDAKHGGPSRSVLGLARAQAAAAGPVALATIADRSATPAPTANLAITGCSAARPRRLARSPALRRYLSEHTFDVLHHHGLWLRPLHYAYQAARRGGRPLVISPRGMMNDWAWHHHRRRKLVAELAVHPGALRGAAGWHATSAQEADAIRQRGFTQPICVAPNGVELPDPEHLQDARKHWLETVPETGSRPVALFYSRFHRKKRVLELIELWARGAPADWLLLLGGIPDEYGTGELKHHVRRVRGEDRIRVFDGTYHPAPYAVASLFLLPSHSENFGLAIAEALAAGVPVLVTDTTPWQEVNAHGAGWCVSWDHFASTMRAALAEDAATLSARGRRGRQWMQRSFGWEASARDLLEFYATLEPSR